MVDARFSVIAALCTLGVAIASALGGTWFVAAAFALLAVGFAIRAAAGLRAGAGRGGRR